MLRLSADFVYLGLPLDYPATTQTLVHRIIIAGQGRKLAIKVVGVHREDYPRNCSRKLDDFRKNNWEQRYDGTEVIAIAILLACVL